MLINVYVHKKRKNNNIVNASYQMEATVNQESRLQFWSKNYYFSTQENFRINSDSCLYAVHK